MRPKRTVAERAEIRRQVARLNVNQLSLLGAVGYARASG
jgi:hypothetical protein